MDVQDLFYITGIVALVLVSAFVIILFYTLYRLTKMARTGMQLLNVTARDIQNSFGIIAKGWGRATLVGVVFKVIKMLWRR
jgi:hypothetical protein